MSRNDYHVIVYQILSYLYVRLKKGEEVEPEMLEYDSVLIKAGNQMYWNYIIWNMYNSGMIEGITFVKIDGAKYPYPAQMENCQITPTGIEYLCDNSFMEKAKQFLKDMKEITPFFIK